ncbi:DUF1266 domain-containing protein [Photobacterium halotolerans]|uniref:DUF1266 domain-containing protein n=2 Tax=Photobacterium halotolerans TaxID=265726 RepID=A0A7X4W8Z0_9GAMM|nr:DUF1266 domain-containing protein [Photobacterium halotolerans]NAW64283.1 DUF1266 domain-containing protein [Photobacterium halotolerans]NAX45955.1 DUF1266 domain-containing protein [Photobacterium halotolerans]
MSSSQYIFDTSLPHCQWWLAITSPQICYSRDLYDYHIPGMRKTDDDLEAWGRSITDSWGIENRRDWHQVIHQLAMAEVHGKIWMSEFSRRACMTSSGWEQRIADADDEVAQGEMRFLDVVYRHVGQVGFKAWDYCRGSFLTRAGYVLGMVTQEEFAFLLNYFSQQIQKQFSGWEQYQHSFIFGRSYWEYINDQDDDQVNIPYLLNSGFSIGYSQFFNLIENDPDIPIPALNWHTELPDIRIPETLRSLLNEKEEG